MFENKLNEYFLQHERFCRLTKHTIANWMVPQRLGGLNSLLLASPPLGASETPVFYVWVMFEAEKIIQISRLSFITKYCLISRENERNQRKWIARRSERSFSAGFLSVWLGWQSCCWRARGGPARLGWGT